MGTASERIPMASISPASSFAVSTPSCRAAATSSGVCAWLGGSCCPASTESSGTSSGVAAK